MSNKFDIMPPEVQAMIMAAAKAKVESIILGITGLQEQAETLIDRLAGESKYLREAYQVQVEPQDLRDGNRCHIAKVEALKSEAREKAKIAISEEVLDNPVKMLPILNERYANAQNTPAQIEKMAGVVKLIGSSKIDYMLVKDDKEEEQGGAAAKTLGASLARSVAIAESEAKNKLPKKQKEDEKGIG